MELIFWCFLRPWFIEQPGYTGSVNYPDGWIFATGPVIQLKLLIVPGTAVYCRTLQCAALYWKTSVRLQLVAFLLLMHCTALHCTSLYCTALHWPSLHCKALNCIELHCTALHCTATALHYNNLHYTALHYTLLPFTALHCRHKYNTFLTMKAAKKQLIPRSSSQGVPDICQAPSIPLCPAVHGLLLTLPPLPPTCNAFYFYF